MTLQNRHAFELRPGLRRGLRSEVPLPTRLVSNEEFPPRRVFGVDVTARRNEIPEDYVSRMKMAYLEEGPAPSHRWYGWVTG